MAIDPLEHIGLAVFVAHRYRSRAVSRGICPDDLRQEALFGLVRAALLYDPGRGFLPSTFLVACIRNRLRNFIGSHRPMQSFPQDEDGQTMDPPAPDGPGQGIGDEVKTLLKGLDYREKETIELKFGFVDGQEWTYDEIGERLGISKQRVEQILSKGMAKLRCAAGQDPHSHDRLFISEGKSPKIRKQPPRRHRPTRERAMA